MGDRYLFFFAKKYKIFIILRQINEKQTKLIITRLTQLTQAKKILLTNIVDARIFGGFVIETSTNVVNINIKDRLKTILNYNC